MFDRFCGRNNIEIGKMSKTEKSSLISTVSQFFLRGIVDGIIRKIFHFATNLIEDMSEKIVFSIILKVLKPTGDDISPRRNDYLGQSYSGICPK